MSYTCYITPGSVDVQASAGPPAGILIQLTWAIVDTDTNTAMPPIGQNSVNFVIDTPATRESIKTDAEYYVQIHSGATPDLTFIWLVEI